MKLPTIPKTPTKPAQPAQPEVRDLRVRVAREEILQGLDEDGKLYHCWEEEHAIGPRNILYSLKTLLELEAEGVVAAHDAWDNVRPFQAQVEYIKAAWAEAPSFDDEGTEGNAYPETLTWRRV